MMKQSKKEKNSTHYFTTYMDAFNKNQSYKELKHLLESNRISFIDLQPVINELLNDRPGFKPEEISSTDKKPFVVDADLGMPLAILVEEILYYLNSIATKPNKISLNKEFSTNTVQLFIYTEKKALAQLMEKESSNRNSLIQDLLEQLPFEVSYNEEELCYKISLSLVENRNRKGKRALNFV